MEVTIDEINSVKKKVTIEVGQDDVEKSFDTAYKKLKKTAKVNGFRPGKAPRAVLERKFGKDVKGDVVNDIIQGTLMAAIQENDLDIIGDPVFDTPEIEDNTPYKYSITVELRPVVGKVDYQGLKLTRTMYKPSDGEIDAQLEMLQRNIAKKEVIDEDRPAQEDDFVLVTYEGLKDGQPFEATPRTENQMYRIGSAHMSRKFDDELIGMKAGDQKEFDIVYEDDYINKTLAGTTIHFAVHLKDIRKEVLPELNDELAKEMGNYETLEDLKAEIVNNLSKSYEQRKNQEINEQIFTALIDQVEFETPEIMVNSELEAMIHEAERAFQMNGISLEQLGKSRDDIREEYREVAEKQVRRHIILSSIIDQDEIELTDEEMAAGYKETAEAINQPEEIVKSFYEQNDDKLKIFKHTLLEKKVINLIIDSSEVTEVEPELETEEE